MGSRKVLTVIGTRPEFLKEAVLGPALRRRHTEILVSTGQHSDAAMSTKLLKDTSGLVPDYSLDWDRGSSQGRPRIVAQITAILRRERPDCVLVFDDTDSTTVGAEAAKAAGLPLAHVEAGARSFNLNMPEEHNRVFVDRLADLLFAPTQIAMRNLRAEGLGDRAFLSGEIVGELVRRFRPSADEQAVSLKTFGLKPGRFYLATIHRAENTVFPNLAELLQALRLLGRVDAPVVIPLHPRTKGAINALLPDLDLDSSGGVKVMSPLGYLQSLTLVENAKQVITDSGTLQREAYYLGTPCLTVRTETEWPETLEEGWNRLVPAKAEALLAAVESSGPGGERTALISKGLSPSGRIADRLACFG